MKIKSIKIEKLYGIFDYDINFPTEENVLLLTGPNGFGKTMILNIVNSFFKNEYSFFYNLKFDYIALELVNEVFLEISHFIKNGRKDVRFKFESGEKKMEFTFLEMYEHYFQMSQTVLGLVRLDDGSRVTWSSLSENRIFSTEELVLKYKLKEYPFFNLFGESAKHHEWFYGGSKGVLKVDIQYIREQRLFQEVIEADNSQLYQHESIVASMVQKYALQLKELIVSKSKESLGFTQELDSSYPARLRSESHIFTEQEYTAKYRVLQQKQAVLRSFGLYERVDEELTFSNEDAKALTVYINDLEKKFAFFDELLEKLQLFTEILNKRRFTFKTIQIDKDKGFYFQSSNGEPLEDLSLLSSGEQHEVVILFELIFNSHPGSLILIDEPEISLHVTWQKEFLKDLLKIVKMRDMQAIVATHAPAIIHDRWDLVYNLEKK